MAKKIHGIDNAKAKKTVDEAAELEAEWKALVREVDDYNRKEEANALADFYAGPVPEIMRSASRARDHMLRNIELVEQGKAPQSLADFNREDMVEMLHAQTYVEYQGSWIAAEKGPEEFDSRVEYLKYCIEKQKEEAEGSWTITSKPDEYKSWLALLRDFKRYLHSAAALAKAIGSSSARLYLRAWKIIEDSWNSYLELQLELSEEEAQTVMRLERVAAERLQIDLLYAELKPYDPQKKENRAGNGAKAGE